MLNYEIDPSRLESRVPHGCELDTWSGRTFVSVVGFRFLRTRVLGVAIPFHRDFEEVNLRFYVRRKCNGEWRRGVVFIKELVPRPAIAFVARTVYGENYVALPMRHELARDGHAMRLAYQWRHGGRWQGLSVTYSGTPEIPGDDSEPAFITEHYWGYSRQADGTTVEYQVEHPRWAVWRAGESHLACDVAGLYGPEFGPALAAPPRTAFVADGSAIVVRRGRRVGGERTR
jgi:uncharacterized protein YqjF (DUF2071 family)